MIKVFDKEEFVEKVFEMEAEYLEQFGLKEVVENKYTELGKWFKDFNCKEETEVFIDDRDMTF